MGFRIENFIIPGHRQGYGIYLDDVGNLTYVHSMVVYRPTLHNDFSLDLQWKNLKKYM